MLNVAFDIPAVLKSPENKCYGVNSHGASNPPGVQLMICECKCVWMRVHEIVHFVTSVQSHSSLCACM